MKKLMYTSLIALLLSAGCRKEAKIKLPEAEEKLVVTSFISPDEQLLSAVVRTSKPKFSQASSSAFDYDEITNAIVVISGPAGSASLVYSDTLQAYFVEKSVFAVQPGISYTLDVKTPDGKHVFASTTVPGDTLRITRLEGTLQRVESTFSNLEVTYSFEVRDNPGQTNYVAMYSRQVMEYTSTWFDPGNFNDAGSGTFEDDENAERTAYKGEGQMSAYMDSVVSVTIELMALNASREFYLYNRSTNQAAYSGDSPFGEPVMVYSNVNNGFGCFGAYRSTYRSLVLR